MSSAGCGSAVPGISLARAMTFARRPPLEDIPDVRDGLTRVERVILYELHKAKAEFGDRYVPSALLYGRVVEHVDIGSAEFHRILARLGGMPSR
jgi:hypothetical protein